MKYVIISSEDEDIVEESVNEHLQSGWMLKGRLKVTGTANFKTVIYTQVMIKE